MCFIDAINNYAANKYCLKHATVTEIQTSEIVSQMTKHLIRNGFQFISE